MCLLWDLSACAALTAFPLLAELQVTSPNAYPTPAELAEMADKAALVVRLLSELRRYYYPNAADFVPDPPVHPLSTGVATAMSASATRPPKRPWEDMAGAGDDADALSAGTGGAHELEECMGVELTPAEKDMETIRQKRAAQTGAAANGAAPGSKGKYRKRSVRVSQYFCGAGLRVRA